MARVNRLRTKYRNYLGFDKTHKQQVSDRNGKTSLIKSDNEEIVWLMEAVVF